MTRNRACSPSRTSRPYRPVAARFGSTVGSWMRLPSPRRRSGRRTLIDPVGREAGAIPSAVTDLEAPGTSSTTRSPTAGSSASRCTTSIAASGSSTPSNEGPPEGGPQVAGVDGRRGVRARGRARDGAMPAAVGEGQSRVVERRARSDRVDGSSTSRASVGFDAETSTRPFAESESWAADGSWSGPAGQGGRGAAPQTQRFRQFVTQFSSKPPPRVRPDGWPYGLRDLLHRGCPPDQGPQFRLRVSRYLELLMAATDRPQASAIRWPAAFAPARLSAESPAGRSCTPWRRWRRDQRPAGSRPQRPSGPLPGLAWASAARRPELKEPARRREGKPRRRWRGVEASTWAAGLPAGDGGGAVGVVLPQPASRQATVSANGASFMLDGSRFVAILTTSDAPMSETRIFRASGAARSTGWPA